MTSFKDYFHLTKDSFAIDPFRDSEVYFGVSDLPKRILRRLQQDFVHQRSVPKFYITAGFGGGKTHTLAFIQYVLTHQEPFCSSHPTFPVFFDIAPIQGKDAWVRIHQRLLDAIGLQTVKDSMTKLLSSSTDTHDPIEVLERSDVLVYGEAGLKNSQTQILRALLFGGRQETVAWDWLKGRALKTDEISMLSIEKNLTEVSDLVNALLNVATLILRATGKKLVLLIDEGEQLTRLTNTDSDQEFHLALRLLLGDENNVMGVVIAYEGATDIASAPRVLMREDILRRIDNERGIIELSQFDEALEAKEFIVEILAYLVDQEKAKKTIAAQKLDAEIQYFPFSSDAVDMIAQHVTDDPTKKLPSEIISIMADSLTSAYVDRGFGADDALDALIDEDDLEASMFPGE